MQKIMLLGLLIVVRSGILFGQDATFKDKERKWSKNNLTNYDNRWLHYGFTIALNNTRFKPTVSDYYLSKTDSVVSIIATRSPGLSLGFILNLKLTDFLDLRLLPTVFSYYQRDVNYIFKNNFAVTQSSESVFIELPLVVKYKSQRRGNFRMYMVGGLKAAIEAGTKKKEKKDSELRTNNYDLCVDYGFGFDIYYPLFKFSPEIRFSHGLLNMLEKDNNIYSRSLNRLTTHTVSLNLNFE